MATAPPPKGQMTAAAQSLDPRWRKQCTSSEEAPTASPLAHTTVTPYPCWLAMVMAMVVAMVMVGVAVVTDYFGHR